jgi:hypothetical protein
VKRESGIEIAVLALLIFAGAGARIFFRDIPNFAPITAISLFAGYYFRRWSFAVLVPLFAMAISDLALGGYQWQMMLVVYSMLTLPVAARPVLRWLMRFEQGRVKTSLAAVAGLVACSGLASCLFYLATNFAWWPWTEMYSHDLSGLVECYTAGLPFFRYTLAGDLFYASLLFGSYAVAVQLGWAKQSAPAIDIGDADFLAQA